MRSYHVESGVNVQRPRRVYIVESEKTIRPKLKRRGWERWQVSDMPKALHFELMMVPGDTCWTITYPGESSKYPKSYVLQASSFQL